MAVVLAARPRAAGRRLGGTSGPLVIATADQHPARLFTTILSAMIDADLAGRLRSAGMPWRPGSGDCFYDSG